MPDKILVIDDEENVRESSMRLLQRIGYDAHGAASGIEALAKISRESFDLLLLDIRMPGMDGIEVLRRAKQMVPDIIVLVLTGHGNIETAIESMELGATGFIRKPVTIENLAKSIDDALARGRTSKENARLRALLPLFELNKVLLSEAAEGKLLSLILDTASSGTRADVTQVLLWDDAGNPIMHAANGLPATEDVSEIATSDEMVAKASSTLQPVVVSRGEGSILNKWEDIHLQKSGCDIYVPLVARGKAIGVLKATKLREGPHFQRSDVEFLFTLCGQSAIAIANARLFESVEREHTEVERLLTRVITNIEDERLRISLELHDGPIQSIVAAQFAVEACRTLVVKKELSQVETKLHNVTQTLLQSIQDLRRIIYDLHPPDLEKSGLLSAVQAYLGNVGRDKGISCHLRVRGTAIHLSRSTERAVYYVVREAITNVIKHAAASEINVLVEFQDDNLIVDVSDNGKGFDLSGEDVGFDIQHLGIRNMKERAKLLKGNTLIESKPGKGTTVKLVVPINKALE